MTTVLITFLVFNFGVFEIPQFVNQPILATTDIALHFGNTWQRSNFLHQDLDDNFNYLIHLRGQLCMQHKNEKEFVLIK